MPAESTSVPPSDAVPPSSGGRGLDYRIAAIMIVAGILATTLPQPGQLGRLPIQNFLKNDLHVQRKTMADFFFLIGLAWYCKPIAGILIDAFPLFGTRRRSYLLGSVSLACLSWLGLILLPKTYTGLLWGCIVINAFMVVTSTVVGAILVETGQSVGATGRLTALRQTIQNGCGIIQGPLGGLLATGALSIAAGVNAAFVFSLFPIAYVLVKEHKVRLDSEHRPLQTARQQLAVIGRSRTMWIALLFIALFYFSPGLGTVMYYRQNDVLKLDQPHIGYLASFGGVFGILGAVLYGKAIKRVDLRTMIAVGVITNALGTLLYLFYTDWPRAILIDSQNGFFFTLAEVAIMDMAARATPKGCEGLGYSLMLSIRNVALFGADVVGAHLADDYKVSFATLVSLSAAFTCVVLFVLPFVPGAIMRAKDSTGPVAQPA